MSIAGFLSYCTINAFTPGPGNLLALNTMADYGFRKSRRLLAGIFLGYYTVQLFCALSVYFLGQHFEFILGYIKYIGAAYIVYLAIHILLSKPSNNNTEKAPKFLSGFLLQLMNVKIYIFGITVLTGYAVHVGNSLLIMLGFSLFVASIGSLATIVWAFFGTVIQGVYQKHYFPIHIVLALLLFYSAFTMIFH